MKKIPAKIVLTLLLCLAMLPFQASTYADGGLRNEIKGDNGSNTYSSDGRDLFYTAANAFKVEPPQSSDYFTQPFSRYISAPMGHSIYAYDYWALSDEHLIDAAFHGSRVTVLAAHGECSCILYYTQDYQLRAGWVRSAYLTAYYPGEESSIGWVVALSPIYVDDPLMSWSRDYFVGTGRQYSVLREPIRNCVNFTLDYQVTSRNGAQTNEVTGPRDVYVNDGSGWTWVGRFQYPNTTACHVSISLPDPMTIAAVAVIADCGKPDTYVCRQSLLDVMCSGGSSRPSSPTPVR